MENEILFHNQYRIPTTRASWNDYNCGWYHVIICTKNKSCFFGHIDSEGLHLSESGIYFDNVINEIPRHHPYARPYLWQVMPNHVHIMLCITTDLKKEDTSFQHPALLAIVIRGIKAAVTRFTRQNGIPFQWQTRYYDVIIKSSAQFRDTEVYVKNNVLHWQDDKYNPDNSTPENDKIPLC
ncbi:MAG: hypothetical protein IJ776_01005 [Paludibacteraceae bacterium]|nr:hypothetical protein [Paludibacteraceae bacterium]